MAYVTTAEAKTYIGGLNTADDDTLIADLITHTESYIESETGRKFDESATTRNFDAVADADGLTLFLDEDLASITSITNGDADSTVITSGQYVTEPRNDTPYYSIRLLSSASVTWEYTNDPEDAIAINGVWAFGATVPEDIKLACLDIVKVLYRSRDANNLTGQTIISGGLVITPSDVPNTTKRTLARYTKNYD